LPDETPSRDAAVEAALARVQEGDVDAFEAVVRHHGPWLRGWCVVRCPPDLEADEIAHRAFITAFREIQAYTPGTNFRAWLATIARHQLLAACKELARRRRRERPGLDDELLTARCALLEEGDEPDLPTEHLARCLEELDDAARELIELRYREGLGARAIGERVQRTPNAISKKLSLLRRRLAECVGRRLGAEER